MLVKGTYVLFGDDQEATYNTENALKQMGLEKPTTGIGMAIGPGEVVDFAVVASFMLYDVAAGNVVEVARTIFEEVHRWLDKGGKLPGVKRADAVFIYEATPEYERVEISIPGCEDKSSEEVGTLVEKFIEANRK